ncbi:MAG: hypothetical protein FJ403_13070 [Verrucomicrobia bacterium]|nr:hypothetical protein [Verrucomicrobiota bacterium]
MDLKDDLRKIEGRLLKLDDEFRRERGAVQQVVRRQLAHACTEMEQAQGRIELLFENMEKETAALQKIAELEEAFRRGVSVAQADELAVQLEEAFIEATGRLWTKPGFKQVPAHPAVNISWDDAAAYCVWLTSKERKERVLGDTHKYRLPTDAEWSIAVGLKNEPGQTPAQRNSKVQGVYPWGSPWPPPKVNSKRARSGNAFPPRYKCLGPAPETIGE